LPSLIYLDYNSSQNPENYTFFANGVKYVTCLKSHKKAVTEQLTVFDQATSGKHMKHFLLLLKEKKKMGIFAACFSLKMSYVITVTHTRHTLNKWLKIMMLENF